ncbi:MAG: ParB/RepB/Spo0J family partition protein [Acidimicrobiia bacterium]
MAGRRRLAAARLAELTEVPCICRELTDDEAADIALVENVHRRDLSALEEGLAYARLRDRGLTQVQIAARVGRSQGTVSALLRVLELPEGLRGRVHRREISYRTALDLAGRRSYRPRAGGESTRGAALTGETAAVASYWRARHERLLVGLQKAARAQANGLGLSALRQMLERLLEADSRPIPGLEQKVAS